MNLNFITSRGPSRLNSFLVALQMLNEEDVARIFDLHVIKDELYDRLEETGNKELLNKIEDIEGQLQIAWKFRDTPDPMWFEHWKVPGCSCPVMDNVDAQGFMKYYSGGCKWHGNLLTNSENKLD